MCEHTGPRHLIEREENGELAKLWMCCACGEVVGSYKKQNINNCVYVPDKHHWVSPKGKIISEYA